MSRSRKKTKIRAITTAASEKEDKQNASRKLRRKIKQKLKSGEQNLPLKREVSNVWSFDKDGRTYDANMTKKDMRK